MLRKIIPVSLICILIDQLIKSIVKSYLVINTSISIIPNFFSITYVENKGAAWSILNGASLLLILISFFSIIGVYFFLIKNKNLSRKEWITYGILLGGIIGNLIDRIKIGAVIDYLDFTFFGYSYPIFNFADICIVLSILGLFLIIREDKNENK